LTVAWEVALVRAPTQFGGLRTFADEAIYRPGVDELTRLLRYVGHLRVTLGDVNNLHTQTASKIAPVAARLRVTGVNAAVARDIQQRLLHKMRNQTRVRSMREHRGGRPRVSGAQGECL